MSLQEAASQVGTSAVGQQSSAPRTFRRLRISWRKELADTKLQSSLMCRWGLFKSHALGWASVCGDDMC